MNQNLLVSRHKKNLTHPVNSVKFRPQSLWVLVPSYMQTVQEEDTAIQESSTNLWSTSGVDNAINYWLDRGQVQNQTLATFQKTRSLFVPSIRLMQGCRGPLLEFNPSTHILDVKLHSISGSFLAKTLRCHSQML